MNLIRRLLAASFALAGLGSAHAVQLSPNGLGQALIYPYYTVNGQQQTLLSVSNTSSFSPQVLNVRFREGYNGRTVMDFRVFLPVGDTWTATVFNLRDAGLDNDGAAILSRDRSCTSPQFASSATQLVDGTPYVAFQNGAYAGALTDGGPQAITRTREGWIEIIALADLLAPLSDAIQPTGIDGAPADCAAVQNLVASEQTSTPRGELMGAASIINVGQGTILATRPEVLTGFTGRNLLTNTAAVFDGLAAVNDGADSSTATARIFDSAGHLQTLTYGNGFGRRIDAVSALFMAGQIQNEYVASAFIGASSDWVVTMPTKPHYTDPLLMGSTTALLPFSEVFRAPGRSDHHGNLARIYDRHERTETFPVQCGFMGCGEQLRLFLGYASTVLGFSNNSYEPLQESHVLRSALVERVLAVLGPDGWFNLFPAYDHFTRLMPASAEGKTLQGLPTIGFWATNLVNNNVSQGVLSNYAMAVPHAATVVCVKASDGTACD